MPWASWEEWAHVRHCLTSSLKELESVEACADEDAACQKQTDGVGRVGPILDHGQFRDGGCGKPALFAAGACMARTRQSATRS
jgi:hypothetical protein